MIEEDETEAETEGGVAIGIEAEIELLDATELIRDEG